jgi:hypothetical protein
MDKQKQALFVGQLVGLIAGFFVFDDQIVQRHGYIFP